MLQRIESTRSWVARRPARSSCSAVIGVVLVVLRSGCPRGLSKGDAGSTSRARSTGWPERTRAAMASVTSQTLTFMPASTRPWRSQKAMYSPLATSPRKTTSS